MVSIRCKLTVRSELEKLGLHYKTVELGEADIEENISTKQWNELNITLKRSGIELLQDRKDIINQKIKNIIVQLVHYSEDPLEINLSDYLAQKLNKDYKYLAKLFSETQGITIEQFYIAHKIEKIKELIEYNELTLTEIAWRLHYSSIAHLSNQFKKVTGVTPSTFKRNEHIKRRGLEEVCTMYTVLATG